ncbi:MAG: hypothetical protein ACOYT7_01230 [Patescibacteria group bacterium]
MEQHPIPQQISSYQFRLVGDMTLKQFFQLAGGALVSLLFYASPLHPLIKWPFIIFFSLLGVALAFLPFEERPLEKWIIAFFRSIYSPTIYFWQQAKVRYVFFQEEAPAPSEKIITPGGEKALERYLSATPRPQIFSALEGAEEAFLSKVTQLFGGGLTPAAPSTQVSAPATKKQEVQIPTVAPVPITEPGARPRVVVEEKPTEPQTAAEVRLTGVAPSWGTRGLIAGEEAQFSPEAAPPLPPTTPNTIVGQILDEEGKIVEGAIMEIRDVAGRPVRALRTNKLGHFLIVTPLSNGRYEVIIEKEGYIFEPIVFTAEGEVIPPIVIRAKKKPQVITQEGAEGAPATL